MNINIRDNTLINGSQCTYKVIVKNVRGSIIGTSISNIVDTNSIYARINNVIVYGEQIKATVNIDGPLFVYEYRVTYGTYDDILYNEYNIIAPYTAEEQTVVSVPQATTDINLYIVPNSGDSPILMDTYTIPAIDSYEIDHDGWVFIDGVMSDGETLSIDTTTLQENNGINGPYSYQWFLETGVGSGSYSQVSTSSTYVVPAGKTGYKINVVFTYVEDDGDIRSIPSLYRIIDGDAPTTGWIDSLEHQNNIIGVKFHATDPDKDNLDWELTYEGNHVNSFGTNWPATYAGMSTGLACEEGTRTVRLWVAKTGEPLVLVDTQSIVVGEVSSGTIESLTVDTTRDYGIELEINLTNSQGNNVSYEVRWGDDSVTSLSNQSPGPLSLTHDYSTGGNKAITLWVNKAFEVPGLVADDNITATEADENPTTGTISISNVNPLVGDTITVTNTVGDIDGVSSGIIYILSETEPGGPFTNILATNVSNYTVTESSIGLKIKVLYEYVETDGDQRQVYSNTTASIPSNAAPQVLNLREHTTNSSPQILNLREHTTNSSPQILNLREHVINSTLDSLYWDAENTDPVYWNTENTDPVYWSN